MSKSIYVVLNGGLGNQLFGIAAALYLNEEIAVLGGISNAHLEQDKEIALKLFDNNPHIEYLKAPIYLRPKLKKIHNLFLISGLRARNSIAVKCAPLLKALVEKTCQIYLRKSFHVHVADNLGFSECRKSNTVLVGYYQSYKWMEKDEVRRTISSAIRAVSLPSELVHFESGTEIIIVHVRLGDYRQEKNFGILPKDYYSRAIAMALSENPTSIIWVFSDEPKIAREYIDERFHSVTQWISESYELDAKATLRAMTLGSTFVIANSTLSWWGAILSDKNTKKVYFPIPWFENATMPRDLIPTDWTPIEAERIKSVDDVF